MRRRARHSTEEPGQDSFLDIVANLVGILIILVMIVGAQAKDAMLQAEVEPAAVEPDEVEAQKDAAVAVQQDLQRLVAKTENQAREIAYRRSERDRILGLMATAEMALGQQRESLSKEQQEAHALQVQIAEARQRQLDLKMSRDAVQLNETPVQVVKHRPTPLAKTVFGREIHFRLKGSRIVFVPLDELLAQFQVEAKTKAWKLRQAPSITETVGPIRDFRLKYTLKKESRAMGSPSAAVVQERVELQGVVLVPVRDDLGESTEVALQPQSQFRSILNSFNPNEATVTIWVYPDSFEDYRQIKEELFQMGFLTASRPLPDGQPISGSPEGTRSAVQ